MGTLRDLDADPPLGEVAFTQDGRRLRLRKRRERPAWLVFEGPRVIAELDRPLDTWRAFSLADVRPTGHAEDWRVALQEVLAERR